MTPCQEVVQGVFGDDGIHPLADVPGSGEVGHPPDQGTAGKLGTSWPAASMGRQNRGRASPLLAELEPRKRRGIRASESLGAGKERQTRDKRDQFGETSKLDIWEQRNSLIFHSLLGDVHNRVYYIYYKQFIVDNRLIRTYGCYFLHIIYVIYCSAYV